jgi:integrase
VVPLSKSLRRILDTYSLPPSTGEWLFPSPRGKRWEPDNFSHALATANEAVGLPWSCLEYRHTFGSQLAQRGLSLFQIAALMGNSPEICRRHYAALVNEQMAGSVDFGAQAAEIAT